jgi:hypothetical protein
MSGAVGGAGNSWVADAGKVGSSAETSPFPGCLRRCPRAASLSRRCGHFFWAAAMVPGDRRTNKGGSLCLLAAPSVPAVPLEDPSRPRRQLETQAGRLGVVAVYGIYRASI